MTEPISREPADVSDVFPTGQGELGVRMGIEITHAVQGLVSASMPVAGNTQPYGLLHGGASVVLAETVGSVAAALHAGPNRAAVGVDISATHHRAAREGRVHATATPLHQGRTIASYEIVIRDDRDARICTARLTCSLIDRPGSKSPSAR